MVFLPPFSKETIREYIDLKTQTQIAGFDLSVKEIMHFEDGGVLDFDNSKRIIPQHVSLEKKGDAWMLKPGGYLVRYNEIVEVPYDAVGIVLPRSSLMRCGATIFSAVWDPGYKGRGVGLMVTYAEIKIHQNTRIAQLMFIKTTEKTTKGYSGDYQNER
ncbi:MAG: deoxyuridine 5'-triphosphate nucleotidohydrolase [Candidatus Heimdallarchaeota archaeon]|nr:deoxyuridine 5'-triphosphate nucleotidohydrolase [Candidatus Heimdallarchaeota archaeon]MCK4876499.1 deoxyuridine 5'-triphosphate nucleotidohydrolase [Candidatus Heimdallarchaeota archaeon]